MKTKLINSKLGRIGLAGLVALMTGCATVRKSTPSFDIKDVPQRNGASVLLDKIAPHDGPETAIYKKAQRQGEKEIAEYTVKAGIGEKWRDIREDAWIFLADDNKWIDVGDAYAVGMEHIKHDKKTGRDIKVIDAGSACSDMNLDAIMNFTKEEDRIIFYHNHPDCHLRFDGKSYSELTPQNFKMSFPSGGDYASFCWLKKELAKKNRKLVQERVVGPLFTVAYDVTKNSGDANNLQKKLDAIAEKTIYGTDESNRKEGLQNYIDEIKKLGINLEITNWNIDESLPWKKTVFDIDNNGKATARTVYEFEKIR